MTQNLLVKYFSRVTNWKITVSRLVFLCLFFLICSSFSIHKFYISKTNIEYNPGTQGFEVSCKFFTDDLEVVLSALSGRKVALNKESNSKEIEAYVEKYISTHLKIWFDDQPILMSYVGIETEADLTYVYFEFFRSNQFHVCKLENTFLYDEFPDQQNIVDMKVDGITSTLILTKKKSIDLIFR